MNIYRPPPVSEQPELEILHWTVKQLPDGNRHVIGVVPVTGHDGRVTSKIMNQEGRAITTRSGRKYHLSGDPGRHHNAEYVWAAWCLYNKINPSETTDVTSEYI